MGAITHWTTIRTKSAAGASGPSASTRRPSASPSNRARPQRSAPNTATRATAPADRASSTSIRARVVTILPRQLDRSGDLPKGSVLTMENRGVISVIGRDQKGIVARISTYLAGQNINIEDIEQRIVEGLFLMSMRVDLTDVSTTLDEVILGLKAIGAEIGVEITLRLSGGRERKRFAILVTKEPQCLEALIRDQRAGKLNGDPVVVLSNHEVLRPVAEAAGMPFFWKDAEDKAVQ